MWLYAAAVYSKLLMEKLGRFILTRPPPLSLEMSRRTWYRRQAEQRKGRSDPGLCRLRAEFSCQMKVHTPAELNAMSLEERKVALSGEFWTSFQAGAVQHVTWIFWARDTHEPTDILGHGSAFMLDFGQGPILVTAAHVYREYLLHQKQFGTLRCQISNTMVSNLSRYEIACGNKKLPLDGPDREPDIATFRLPVGAAERLGKRPIVASPNWPPSPRPNEQVLVGGFPGQERIRISSTEMCFGFHSGMFPVASLTDHQITLRFEREFMIDGSGKGLPPLGYGLGVSVGARFLFQTFGMGHGPGGLAEWSARPLKRGNPRRCCSR